MTPTGTEALRDLVARNLVAARGRRPVADRLRR